MIVVNKTEKPIARVTIMKQSVLVENGNQEKAVFLKVVDLNLSNYKSAQKRLEHMKRLMLDEPAK